MSSGIPGESAGKPGESPGAPGTYPAVPGDSPGMPVSGLPVQTVQGRQYEEDKIEEDGAKRENDCHGTT